MLTSEVFYVKLDLAGCIYVAVVLWETFWSNQNQQIVYGDKMLGLAEAAVSSPFFISMEGD